MVLQKEVIFIFNLRTLQAKLDQRLQITELAAAVITDTFELICQHCFLFKQRGNTISQLQLSACAWLQAVKVCKNRGCQDLPSHHSQIGWRIFRCRLFHDPVQLLQAVTDKAGSCPHPVGIALFLLNRLHPDNAAAVLRIQQGYLLHHRNLGLQQIIGQNDCKWTVIDQSLSTKYCATQIQCLSLISGND